MPSPPTMRAVSSEDSAMNTAISAKTVVKRCEAWKASAVLGKNYPETYWYRQSLRLLHSEQKHTGMWTAAGPLPSKAGAEPAKASNYPEGPKANAYPQGGKPDGQKPSGQ